MERYICIHGHFYQPPRENPWLEEIEVQDSAHTYHDWNKRITAECYATNSKSRILDEQKRIEQIVNNYAKISFNFGPTLLSWMEKEAHDVYNAILEADKESRLNFSDHGSAIAQAYNHVIMPLASAQDKYTQILWGIRDFEHRFDHEPEGMWLPETAVDLESLDMMAQLGISFTILAPHQAGRVRRIGEEEWKIIEEGHIDTLMPYSLQLPSGRKINLFFYNGPISRAVAFEKLLSNGEIFAHRLMGGFIEGEERPQLVHIATDGESYGHHHRFGDMALSYALQYIEVHHHVRLTNYGEYLAHHPPTHEVEILENTSWSCSHGIERWRNDCGCNTGANPGWRQAWRGPLRTSFDQLWEELARIYEERAGALVKDPWAARDDYIGVILHRSSEKTKAFIKAHEVRRLNDGESIQLLKLQEMQRHAMLMFTSCGWFFDDLSGIETVQVMQYAARAIQLAQEITEQILDPPFLNHIKGAKSNKPEYGDGLSIYEEHVKPAMADLYTVAAHYAMCSLFEEYNAQTVIYCYRVEEEESQVFESGKARLILGKARFISGITQESVLLGFGALHLGDHNLTCGVHEYSGAEDDASMLMAVSEPFESADFPETIRRMAKVFGEPSYGLKSLFRNEKRKILYEILETTLTEAESVYRHLYEDHASLMRFLKDSGVPAPGLLKMAAELVVNTGLRRAFEYGDFDSELIQRLLDEARTEGLNLDVTALEYAFRKTLESIAEAFSSNTEDLSRLEGLGGALGILDCLPFQVNRWKVQNIFYDILKSVFPEMNKKAMEGDKTAKQWVSHFTALREKLNLLGAE
ncbi:MAG: DUF3536 domain-containing protein [Deltaproteobacteria bacterium]|nr:DUF3536 domain-containing protein [Deltaproteobacteria bacterium]